MKTFRCRLVRRRIHHGRWIVMANRHLFKHDVGPQALLRQLTQELRAIALLGNQPTKIGLNKSFLLTLLD